MEFEVLITIGRVCKRFRQILDKANLWKLFCANRFPLIPNNSFHAVVRDLNKDWRWLAVTVYVSLPRNRSVQANKSLRQRITAMCRGKSDSKKSLPKDEALRGIITNVQLGHFVSARVLMRFMWENKEFSARVLTLLVGCIEKAQVNDLQHYFEVAGQILRSMWPHLRKNVSVFMEEILQMFLRKKDRKEVLEWRECARQLQKLANNSMHLRKWLIANKKKWEWLPQYYTQTRFVPPSQ
jgi:hypothetical protein